MPRAKATLTQARHIIQVALEMVDPETAAKWLSETNHRNRKINAARVRAIAEAMARGNFILNGATIVFDTNGVLSDGQHRLMAIIEAGVPVLLIVVRGVEPEIAQDTTDAGAKRTLAQQLSIRGEKLVTVLAPAIATVHCVIVCGVPPGTSSAYPTVIEGLELLREHPDIRQSTSMGKVAISSEIRYSGGIAAGLHYLFRLAGGEEAATAFWDLLITGDLLASGDPVFALRRMMLTDASLPRGRQRMAQPFRAAVTVKAWNKYLRGEEAARLAWIAGGAKPEAFPLIEGLELEGDDG